jgi:signal transduction histidine kinase
VLLVALLVVLATLQYRWTGELGRAEEDQLRTSLNRAAAGIAADFDRELGRLFFHFLQMPTPDAPEMSDAEASLVERVTSWRAQPPYPEMLRQVLVVEHGAGGAPALRAFDEATHDWVAVPWPPELAGLRRQIESPGGHEWMPIAADGPVLVVPLWHRFGGERRAGFLGRVDPGVERREPGERDLRVPGSPGQPEDEPGGAALLWLDTAAVRDRVLPALVDRHLGGEVDYRVEVRDGDGREVFAQGPAIAAGRPDVVMPLFRLPLAERMARHHAERHAAMRMRTPAPPFGDDPGFRGRWLLSVTHPAGSLAAAVTRVRWRNLAVSFVVLGLLAAAVGLVLAAARRAEALARRQIELVAGVSHELLTPVAAVRSAGENLAAGVVTDPAKVREYGEMVVREGRRLGSLVEQVLTWAGLQARGEPATRAAVDAGSLVESVVAAVADEAKRGGVALESRVAGALPPVAGDRDALERALRNLVENALRHGGSGGWVGVDASAVEANGGPPRVVLAVEDRGAGLAADELPHLFEPFYRGSGAKAPGSGLGLALARQIAEAHGGRVEVARVQPHGARFTLELPAMPAEGAA